MGFMFSKEKVALKFYLILNDYESIQSFKLNNKISLILY